MWFLAVARSNEVAGVSVRRLAGVRCSPSIDSAHTNDLQARTSRNFLWLKVYSNGGRESSQKVGQKRKCNYPSSMCWTDTYISACSSQIDRRSGELVDNSEDQDENESIVLTQIVLSC